MKLNTDTLINSNDIKDFPKKVRDHNDYHPADHYSSELSENIDEILNMDKNYNIDGIYIGIDNRFTFQYL